MKTLIVCFLALSTSMSQAQVQAVERFLEEQDHLSKYYIYQSTLRMLNEGGNPDFNKLIKGIRKINVYVAEEGEEVAGSSYQRLVRDLGSEKFETLVSAKNGNMHLNLMSREAGNTSYYILAVKEDAEFALLEMDGQLDLRYLSVLEDVNFTKLRKLVSKDANSEPRKEEIRD